MGMMLGNRQLAMLREMGVRVWQPKAASNADAAAIDSLPISAPTVAVPEQMRAPNAPGLVAVRARTHSDTKINGIESPAAPPLREPKAQTAPGAWHVGPAQELYSSTSTQPNARWLVLLEAPGEALQGGFHPLEGDAGKLLDNMLRAAHLHASGGVTVVPLARYSGVAGPASAELSQALAEQVATMQPAVILVMGRLAAQAALQSSEPLAKLRGRVHQLHGTPAIVTIEPVYLLRNPLDKAKAWDDLCLALNLASP